jgi:hypothetical protein
VHHRSQAVESKSNASVRRRAILESAEQEAELRFGLLRA